MFKLIKGIWLYYTNTIFRQSIDFKSEQDFAIRSFRKLKEEMENQLTTNQDNITAETPPDKKTSGGNIQ